MTKELILSVTLADCDVQTFRSSGPGGQHRDHGNSGVRVIHRASGARGECSETRSQHDNKRAAFTRMAATPTFKAWLAVASGRIKSDTQIAAEIDDDLRKPGHLRTEVRENDRWTEKSI